MGLARRGRDLFDARGDLEAADDSLHGVVANISTDTDPQINAGAKGRVT